ncbi:MAG TPA: UDP-N-acetylmuramoylalanyl-D-glutamyl-2, 6-diaminopimelate--D-alanyl-D-alanine ligase, partial [Hyphomicrobium sp.]|nr:UDP-N-acetylmuramoylalanyl-D-glutamyl-2, 6-diaminopimelate--D-alanyl-D-alanine ligase [Hyphomicrobium sp.]
TDLVFASGPNMEHLFRALPPERQGAWALRSGEIEDALVARLQPGDVVMVKGSNGSRMGPLADALRKRFAAG